MNNSKKSNVQDHSNVQKSDILSITLPMINRMKIEDKSEQTITSYVRAVERLVRFHDLVHPSELEIDEVYDFLVSLNEKDQVNWRTNKMYVAGLRYYWTHLLDDSEFADKIPYPKEHPSLPKILSREELKIFFDSCNNDKHKVMFRLMYSSGLRRSELRHLKIQDIETKDGKSRIRVVKGKGKKDRYTYSINWVAYAKKAFGGPQQVLEYIRIKYASVIIALKILQIRMLLLSTLTVRPINQKVKLSQENNSSSCLLSTFFQKVLYASGTLVF